MNHPLDNRFHQHRTAQAQYLFAHDLRQCPQDETVRKLEGVGPLDAPRLGEVSNHLNSPRALPCPAKESRECAPTRDRSDFRLIMT
jgi:hypothetical protein